MINLLLAERYECLQKIGSGGMGDVYKAHDRRLDRIVAIKILKSEYNEDDNFIRKFRRESLAAASISHPNIVSIFDVGMEVVDGSNLYYIVMEYIDGKTLKELIREEGVISQSQALNYLIQISEALKVAHSKNIVHRDIKSQNIMVTRDNRVKVTDFGIARMAGNSTVTVTNAVMGSVHYFSPEQARGQKVDARSDIYSMGIVLYEMLTGKVPFDSENPITVALMHVQNVIPLPSEENPRISQGIDLIFQKMTQKKPQDRYDNVSQIIEDVKSILLNKVPSHNGPNPSPSFKNGYTDTYETKRMVNSKPAGPPQVDRNRPSSVKKKEEKSKFPAILGGIAALIFLILIFIVGPKALNMFSGKNDLIVMENLVGKTLTEAEAFAGENELKLEVSDIEFTNDVEPDTVLRQSIEADSKLKKGDKFSVVISGEKENVKVPNLSNMSVSEAQDKLSTYGLDLVVDGVEYSDKVPKDRIIYQEPKSGNKVEKNSSIHVVISSGPETKLTTVPNLKGVTVEKAKLLLEQQGLQLGNVSEDKDSSVGKGDVFWQQYNSGDKIEIGTKVDLLISSGLPNDSGQGGEDNGSESNAEKQKRLNLVVELSDDGQSHDVQIIKKTSSGETVVESFSANGGQKTTIPVSGAVGDQFDIYVDNQKMKSETVK